MSDLPELQLINSICEDKDIHLIIGEDMQVFGPFQDVFEGCKNYYLKYRTVPTFDVLADRYKIEKVTAPAASQFYLDQVKANYIRSKMEDSITRASKVWDKDSPSKILEELLTDLSSLTRHTSNARDLDLTDWEDAENYFERLRDMADASGTPGIPTGFKAIDAVYTTGWAPGHMITVFGYTGRMKSFFALLAAIRAWLQGRKVMVVSLEMNPEEVRERAYALIASGLFDMNKLARGDVDKDDFREWAKNNLTNKAGFIVISPEGLGEMTPNVVRSKAEVHRPDFIVMDYAQLFKDNAKTPAMTPRMLNLSRETKILAGDLGIPIMFLSAVTDDENDKRDSPPLLSQIAWSSGIEYDSNLAIAVHKYDDSNIVEVVSRKNRNGPNFGFYFEVDPARGIFEEKFEL